ncbi:MAG: hypothetical protein JXA93_00505 [Anaerolineae bacterium]|nr:hypothetical protein [Anaerolineae bacterium]
MDTQTEEGATKIVPPAGFPVDWPRPDFAAMYWTRDREHLPDPVTPLFHSCAHEMASATRERTAPVYEEAIVQQYHLPVNHYLYTSLVPFRGSPEELATRAARNRDRLTAAALSLPDTWAREWQPEIEAHWSFWAGFDLARAPLPALIEHLDESLVRGARLYLIHYLLGPPIWFAIAEFESFFRDLFPGATRLDAHALLGGFDNKTLQAGRALWRLGRLAAACPAVRRIVHDAPASRVPAALGRLNGDARAAAPFLHALRRYLATYGRRSSLWDWGYPSWEDDPTPVFANLRHYVARSERDLEAEQAAAAARRETAVARARRELSGFPGPVVERFDTLLAAAQTALVLSEDHTYWIDFNGFGWLHRIAAELGRRLAAAGGLARTADIFYLKIDEVRAMGQGDHDTAWSKIAARRRAELAYWAAFDEPPELGTRPAELPAFYSPDARRTGRYTGALPPRQALSGPCEPETPGLLRGQAGAPGTVRARARLVSTLADAARLQPGEILVTRTTAPPWTPLFYTAAALVTDAGGLLSHGAVVAREIGIPAVVGTAHATARIPDGAMLQVDGTAGVVRWA